MSKNKDNRHIAKYISQLYRKSFIFINREVDKYDIKSGQLMFLLDLYTKDGKNQEEISARLKIDKGTTARALKKLEELHALLIRDLGVDKGLRKSPVGIVGTNYKPLSNQLQIKEAVDKLINTINGTENIIEKALITVLMISYIQPFEDGNKRTGRILANAILFANDYCPLSYRSINESDYKKAVIIFYENNSLDYFKKLFVEQFKFAVEKYF